MKQSKAEFIDPRQHGQRGLELRKPVFDEAAIARAEDAVQAFSGSFPKWLEADLNRLQELRRGAEAADWADEALHALHASAHDLKGLGATYGYPIVTQLAASLCRLVETDTGRALTRQNPVLARAHVDALRAVVRADVRSGDHPVGAALLQELETQVHALAG